jgi:WD40 repeat protein
LQNKADAKNVNAIHRYPGHPQSIDAILKIDEDTVLTGSSDGLVCAVKLLPNGLLDVLGGHDGFPVEALGWSAGRKMLRSVSHDECIRLWVRIVLFAHRNVSLSTSMMQKRRQLER